MSNLMKRRIILVMAAISILMSVAGGGAWADEPPTFIIPRLTKAPKIDGKLDWSGWPKWEWGMAVILSGFTQTHKPMAAEGLQNVWLGYDDEALYICSSRYSIGGTALKSSVRKRDDAAWKDDSVEVHVGVGRNPARTYQLVVNAHNSIYDATNRGRKHDATWNGDWTHGAMRRGDGWDAEMAIPWKTLGLKAPERGQILRINVAFNCSVPGVSGVRPASWGPIVDSSGKKRHTFSTIGVMPVARLGGDGPAVGSSVMYSKSGEVQVRISAVNPAPNPVTIQYSTDPRWWSKRNLAGNKRTSILLPVKLDKNGLGSQPVAIKGPDGDVIFRQTIRFRSRIGSNLSLRKYFPDNYLELGNAEGFPLKGIVEVSVRDKKKRLVSESAVTIGPAQRKAVRIDISNWKEAVPHVLFVTIKAKDGRTLAQREFEVTRPKPPEWLHTKAGLTDKPLPPFTAIRVVDTRLECLQTAYDFGARSLPVAITASGENLIARPVQLTVAMDGRTTDIADAPIRLISRKSNRVGWESEKSVGDARFALKGWMEEDGFVWYRLTVAPTAQVTIDALTFSVPLRRNYAKWVNAAMPLEMGEEDAFALRDNGWKAAKFFPMITLLNEDRGITVMAPDPRAWSNQAADTRQRIEVSADAAALTFAFVDKPTRFDGLRVYEFGFQAMPAKPVIRNAARHRKIHCIKYGYDTQATWIHGAGTVEYPMKDNVNLSQGTLEAWVFADFDASATPGLPEYRWHLDQRLLKLDVPGVTGYLKWSAGSRAWEFCCAAGKSKAALVQPKALNWPKPAWHHVALTWGEVLRLYADGRLVGEAAANGLIMPKYAAEAMRLGRLVFGKDRKSNRSAFRLGGLRISSRSLAPDEMATDGVFTKTPDTLLIQDFSKMPVGKALALPAAGRPGTLKGAATVVEQKGIRALTFGPIPMFSLLEHAAQMGASTLIHHDRWTEDFGLPFTREKRKQLRSLVDACHRRNVRYIVYLGYGVGAFAPESKLYDEYWRREPVHAWAGQGRRYFRAWCNNTEYATDFILDGVAKTLKEFDVDGLYYDGTAMTYPCKNTHHGCGWKDAGGQLCRSFPLLKNRRFAKRLYAVVKQHRPDGWVDWHCSGGACAWLAAWSDGAFSGEQFIGRTGKGKEMLDLDMMCAQLSGPAYGTKFDYTWLYKRPLTLDQQMAFTLHLDVEPRAMLYKEKNLAIISRLWRIKDRFGINEAEWVPFTKTAGFVTVEGGRSYASLHLIKGERALVVVSNLQDKAADVSVKFNLARLGLTGKVKDAATQSDIPVANGRLSLSMGPYAWNMLWVE